MTKRSSERSSGGREISPNQPPNDTWISKLEDCPSCRLVMHRIMNLTGFANAQRQMPRSNVAMSRRVRHPSRHAIPQC